MFWRQKKEKKKKKRKGQQTLFQVGEAKPVTVDTGAASGSDMPPAHHD